MAAPSSAPRAAASARPTRTRWGAAQFASVICATWRRSGPGSASCCSHHNALRRGFAIPDADAAQLEHDLLAIAPRLLPFTAPVWRRLDRARQEGKRILFEGAQGAMLDIDHGTYPFVTSSNTLAGQAAAGAGVGPGTIGYVLGITKAYTTRVGGGPFPTELHDEVGPRPRRARARVRHRDRPSPPLRLVRRRAGAPGGQDRRHQGASRSPSSTCSTAWRSSRCAFGYRSNGAVLDHIPAAAADQALVRPVYETFDGWQESTRGARSWADLPATAVKYIRRIEELIEAPVAMLSTSPEREDTILVRDPLRELALPLRRQPAPCRRRRAGRWACRRRGESPPQSPPPPVARLLRRAAGPGSASQPAARPR